MKKIAFILSFVLIFSPMLAHAETIVIVDQNNVVRQQIYTQPMGTYAPQPVYVQPQQVYVQQPVPQTVVVRETVTPRSYYYDSFATSMVAGITGIAIGSALFGHHHHHGGGHHGGGHHGGGHHGGGHHGGGHHHR